MSTAGGVWKALQRSLGIGCEIIQIFVKNNMQWFGKPCSPSGVATFASELAASKLASVFGHTGYLINLAAPPSTKRDQSIKSLIQEIQLAGQLGLPFLVMHPGAHLGAGETAGLNRVAAGLNEVLSATKTSTVRIALRVFDKVERFNGCAVVVRSATAGGFNSMTNLPGFGRVTGISTLSRAG